MLLNTKIGIKQTIFLYCHRFVTFFCQCPSVKNSKKVKIALKRNFFPITICKFDVHTLSTRSPFSSKKNTVMPLNCAPSDLSPYQPSSALPWNHRRALHLYRRTAFGASRPTIENALLQNPKELVATIVDQAKTTTRYPTGMGQLGHQQLQCQRRRKKCTNRTSDCFLGQHMDERFSHQWAARSHGSFLAQPFCDQT